MNDWSTQRFWEEVRPGDRVRTVDFPLTLHRMVVHSAAVLDFDPTHFNTMVARSQYAPEAYADNVFALGTWERAVREYIGLGGVIKKLGLLRILTFNARRGDRNGFRRGCPNAARGGVSTSSN